MSEEATYGLVEPFDCDDPLFCLGVEWEMFRREMDTGKPFTRTVHADNLTRLIKMVERHGRFVESVSLAEPCQEWGTIIVGTKK